MTVASAIFDWLADFFRDRRTCLSRQELLDAFNALGVMHANLLDARRDVSAFKEIAREDESLESHVTFAPYRGEPSAYERRQRHFVEPILLESRAQVAAKLLGRGNVESWHAMLDTSGRFKGMLNGSHLGKSPRGERS